MNFTIVLNAIQIKQTRSNWHEQVKLYEKNSTRIFQFFLDVSYVSRSILKNNKTFSIIPT